MSTSALLCSAQHWQEVGKVANTLDTVFLDADSIEQQDGFRIVLIKTAYPEPRLNKSNITLDSHIQQTAIDCEKRTFYGIRTFGYLNGKQMGTSPVTADWKTKMLPMKSDAISQRILSTACSLPITNETKALATTAPTPQPASKAAKQSATPASPQPALPGGENLLFAQPKGFKIGYTKPANLMTEFIPNGETVEDWTEMLTVQIFPNRKEGEPADFLQAIGKVYTTSCPGFTSPKGIVTGPDNGYVVSMLLMTCPNNPATGKPETTLFRVIKGKVELYTIQHAWRSLPSEKDLQDAVIAFRKISLCDTREPTHPCSSLDAAAGPFH